MAYAVATLDVAAPATVADTPLGAAVNWLWCTHKIMAGHNATPEQVREMFVKVCTGQPPSYIVEVEITVKHRMADSSIVDPASTH